MLFLFQFLWIILKMAYMDHRRRNITDAQFTRQPVSDAAEDADADDPGHMWSSAGAPNRRVILFLSGMFTCSYESYIHKTVHDLLASSPDIAEKYTILIYENRRKASIEVAGHIVQYLADYHRARDLDKLVIFGFSAGGILASHVMHSLDFLPKKCVKHIITYDSPMSIAQSMRRFSQNRIYRVDLLYFHIIMQSYRQNCRYPRIKPLIDDYIGAHGTQEFTSAPKYAGVDAWFGLIRQIHGIDEAEFNYRTAFEYAQPANTQITHFYCANDPIIDREFNRDHCAKYRNPLLPVRFVEKPLSDHCTDMWRSDEYIADIRAVIQ